ncbi:unnamed protein product [Ilex paraguariensis]|uniref:Uncharacterized protein n=1 Tax=Ilex paraguariensis TaxID=185542 RepID=A0ABC8QT52_9AQUA
MSVQDAINLFERKQRDQTVQTTGSVLNASVGANKSVLRRWSAGMGESSAQCIPDNVAESSVTPIGEIQTSSQEVESKPDVISGASSPVETAEVVDKLNSSVKRGSHPMGVQADTLLTERDGSNEKLTASAEWSRQKEAELNQLLMKMMESKPVRYQKAGPDNSKSQNVPSQLGAGFYDHYKEKRNEKLRGEASGKRAEKEAQFRAMQQILDERKAEMASATASHVGRRHPGSKPQKSPKDLRQSANPKKETSKPTVVKKASSKPSPLPAMRKSWPSTPSPRATGTSPAKTPAGTISAGTTPTRRKPQPAPSVPRSSPKVERSQPRPKTVKATLNDTHKSIKGVNEKRQHTVTEKKQQTVTEKKQQQTMTEKKQQTVMKSGRTTKAKAQNNSGDDSSMMKPNSYSKVKKSTVVPLESKPFLRKGSGIGPGVGSVAKTKFPSQPEESLRNSGDIIQAEEKEVVATNTSDMVTQQQESNLEAQEIPGDLEPGTTESNITKECEDTESTSQVTANDDDSFPRMAESALKTEAEEVSIISPAAWVEIEELPDEPIPCNENTSQLASSATVALVGMSSPRVRHSLSQMLLEDSSEPDTTEWGIAENPPAMIYQKDSPKGLKRLLKFARKSKPDSNLTGWASPPVFSEGEDDAEESGAASKKNADNLLRKATLHAKNYRQPKSFSSEAYEKNSTAHELYAQSKQSKSDAQSSSHKLQEGHIFTSATTTKAFRGSKPNETKLH